jgi:hypothetical protein
MVREYCEVILVYIELLPEPQAELVGEKLHLLPTFH